MPKRKPLTTINGAYWAGFSRAVELCLGTKVTWAGDELLVRNRVTRKLFGKKRK